MRPINEIIIHCAATPEGRNVTVDDIRRWHVEDNGWDDIGYHYVIHLDGSVHKGRPVEKVGAHVRGHNNYTIGICYVGGIDTSQQPKDTRTDAQQKALVQLCYDLVRRYPAINNISGHNEYAAKACPSFDVQADAKIQATLTQITPPVGDLDDEEEAAKLVEEARQLLWRASKLMGWVE